MWNFFASAYCSFPTSVPQEKASESTYPGFPRSQVNNESRKFRKGVVAVTWWYVSVTEEAPPPIIEWNLVQEFSFFWVFLKEVFLLLLNLVLHEKGKTEPSLAHGSRIYKNNKQELFFFIIVTNLNSVLEKWNTKINKKKGSAGWKHGHYLKVLTTTDK